MGIFVGVLMVVAIIANSFAPLADRPKEELLIQGGTPGMELLLHETVKKPLSKYRHSNIVLQEYDYSCGSAALATILNFYLGENLTEEEVIKGLISFGDKKQIENRRAFSLLDMKRFVKELGYNVAGYTAETEDLLSLGMPCIVPVEIYGYKHFVVFRGAYEGHVFVADPYLGNVSFDADYFEKIWYKNIVFLVTNAGDEIDNLILSDEDLRVLDFDMTQEALNAYSPPRSVRLDQQRLRESTGKYFYIHN